MPYPNRTQWVVIWLTLLVAAHFWLGLRLRDIWPGNAEGGWGLYAYLEPAIRYGSRPRLAGTIVAVGVLLIWMASRPLPRSAWNSAKLRRFKRALVALGVLVGCGIAISVVSAVTRISRDLPAGEVSKLDGRGSVSYGAFEGTLYNGTQDWTVRQVTIRIVHGEHVAPGDREFHETDEKEYRLDGLSIAPLRTQPIHVEIISPNSLPFDSWQIVAAKGFKKLW